MSPLRPEAPAGQGGDMPKAGIGRMVHVELAEEHNGTKLAPGIITRAWGGSGDLVNVTVFPDCDLPLTRGSVFRKDLAPEGYRGPVWYWPPRV